MYGKMHAIFANLWSYVLSITSRLSSHQMHAEVRVRVEKSLNRFCTRYIKQNIECHMTPFQLKGYSLTNKPSSNNNSFVHQSVEISKGTANFISVIHDHPIKHRKTC